MAGRWSKIVIFGAAGLAGAVCVSNIITNKNTDMLCKYKPLQASDESIFRNKRHLPTRSEQLKSLQTEEFDVLIIGGGATGSGCALDAVTRGLKTALVEMDDFSSGTSSKSTKLIHGGVRYLQKAIIGRNKEQFKLVKEALADRAWMINFAPYLAKPLPIMIPLYEYWKIPYYWFGIKMYDLISYGKKLNSSYFLSKKNTLKLFPMLRCDDLLGSIVYYDGQMDDARMNLAVALTATRYGATIANHVKVLKLYHDKNCKLCGALVRDELTHKEWNIRSKCIINATGPMTDTIRKMDDQNVAEICSPSSGVHVVLPGYYSPANMGLLDPETVDGRVIFFLPWQRHTIVGTTDLPCEVTHKPQPTEEEISFILHEIRNYFNKDVEIRRGDVLSSWSGIRPLVSDPNNPDTESLARNHIIHVSDSNLITIAGGKWTTFRTMAVCTINTAIEACDLQPTSRRTQMNKVLVEGTHGWSPTMHIRLVQDFGLEPEVAEHLSNTYGDRSCAVAQLASVTGNRWPIIGKKIHPEFPYIDAEIRYGVYEYACTAIDMIARRLRLSFLNVQAAEESLPLIVDIMAEELKWNEAEKARQIEMCSEFLQCEMGLYVNRNLKQTFPINLTKNEMQLYIERFKDIDIEKKGYVSTNDIRQNLKNNGEIIEGEKLHEILSLIDLNMNGQVELDEYLQMISLIKNNNGTCSQFTKIVGMEEKMYKKAKLNVKISPERSGGGV